MRTDNAGNVPATGDYVAFNRSGQIATGYIERIGRGQWGPIYYIRVVLPTRDDGKQSIVKGGALCLLVLDAAAERDDNG